MSSMKRSLASDREFDDRSIRILAAGGAVQRSPDSSGDGDPSRTEREDAAYQREWIDAVEEDLAQALEVARRQRLRIDELTEMTDRMLNERSERIARVTALNTSNGRLREDLNRTQQELTARQATTVRMTAELGKLQSAVEELDVARRDLANRLEAATREAKQLRADAAAREEHIACLEGELRAERKAREAAMAEAFDLRRQSEIDAARLNAALRVADTGRGPEVPPGGPAFGAARPAPGPGGMPTPRATTAAAIAAAPAAPLRPARRPASPAPGSVPAAAGQNRFLIVDTSAAADEAAQRLTARGYPATVLRADVPVASQVGGESAWAAAINLASAVGWMAATELRRLSVRPLLACALDATGANAIWLGSVDFAESPADDGRIAALLDKLAPRVKRALILGEPNGALQSVLDACKNAKLQTAVTLGDQETLETVGTLRPEAVIVHVAQPCASVFRAMLAVRTVDAMRHAPILFLLATPSQRPDPITLAESLAAIAPNGSMPRGDLADAFASALEIQRLKALTGVGGR